MHPAAAILRSLTPPALLLVLPVPASPQVTWSRLGPVHPPGRAVAAMAFDTGRARTVLFGGSEFNLLSDQTWEWDGSQWTRLFPTTSPAPRTRSAAAFDEQRGRVVLFGGITSGGYGADTWEWDGAQWTPRQPVHAPGGRYGHALAYDPARGRVVLFGGQNGPVLADTWEWDGSDWIRRTPNGAPPARSSHAMAYDSARAQLLVFGGLRQRTLDDAEFLDDTWRYTPDHPARFAAYGAGCAGSAGGPTCSRPPARRRGWVIASRCRWRACRR